MAEWNEYFNFFLICIVVFFGIFFWVLIAWNFICGGDGLDFFSLSCILFSLFLWVILSLSSLLLFFVFHHLLRPISSVLWASLVLIGRNALYVVSFLRELYISPKYYIFLGQWCWSNEQTSLQFSVEGNDLIYLLSHSNFNSVFDVLIMNQMIPGSWKESSAIFLCLWIATFSFA